MTALLLATLALSAAEVRFVAKVEPRPWQPLDPADVERILEQKVLEVLGKSGSMRLEKSGFAELKNGDYALLIEGRFIEEAEKFSTYVTFSPGKVPVASFHVIDTADLGRRTPQQMQKLITELAQKSAERLATLIEPQLGLPQAPPAVEPEPLPLDFGAIDIPVVKAPSGAVQKLTDVRNEDHVRWEGYNALAEHAFDQEPARLAMERCALYDPLPDLRSHCVEALAPVARTRIETQRLLLHAMRNEVDPGVLSDITSVSKSFVGLSRKEAIATWLEVISSPGTPGEACSTIAGLIAAEKNVPNLGLAVARCLNSETLAYGQKAACAQYLLPNVPKEQRFAAVQRFLETAQMWDSGASNVMDDIEQHVFERGSKPIDPAMAAVLQRLVTERRTVRAHHTMIYALARHPHPTPETVEAILQSSLLNDNPYFEWNALSDLFHDHPELRETGLLQLERFAAAHDLNARPEGSGGKDLEKLIKSLKEKK